MISGPLAPHDDHHGESWDAWRARIDRSVSDLLAMRRTIEEIYRAVAGGTEQDEVGLREGQRDLLRRVSDLETRLKDHHEDIAEMKAAGDRRTAKALWDTLKMVASAALGAAAYWLTGSRHH